VESEKVKSMMAVTSISDQSVVLRDVQWETYERLLADHQDSRGPRFNYDCGTLEIMAPSFKDESLKETIARLFEMAAEASGVEYIAAGSTTFRRQDLRKGFEPDACFYVRDLEHLRTKDEINLAIDPPPDLVVEIDLTNRAINKLQLFAALGIREVWCFQSGELQIFVWNSGMYSRSSVSSILQGVDSSEVTTLILSSRETPMLLWLETARVWARK
jgi:Uma2 family endonuclease